MKTKHDIRRDGLCRLTSVKPQLKMRVSSLLDDQVNEVKVFMRIAKCLL